MDRKKSRKLGEGEREEETPFLEKGGQENRRLGGRRREKRKEVEE